jgi:ABC-2 type transport system permease protein
MMKEKLSTLDLVKIHYWLFVKQKINRLLFVAFLVAGFYALYQGFAFKAKQITTIDAFRKDKISDLDEMVKGFQADTTTNEGRAAYEKVTLLNWANWYTVLPATKAPTTTAIYSIGQSDMFPYYYTVKLESFFMQLFKQNEIQNPLRSLAGHFDGSFWIVYLLPLLIIVLCFNILPAELDNGNWRLINSQGINPRQWVKGKILLVALFVECLVLLIFLGGIMLNYFYFNQTPTSSDVFFFIGANLYLGFWLSALYFLNALAMNTSASALYSGVLWVFICIVAPTLVTTIVEKVVPVDNTLISRMSRRPQGSKFDDNEFGLKTIKQLGELRPQYKEASIGPESKWFRFSVYFAYHELLDDSNRVAVAQYFEDVELRQKLINASSIINPAASIDGMFAGLASNDAAANHQFVWRVKDIHGKFHDAFFPAVFFDRTLEESDYKKLPVSGNPFFKKVSATTFIHFLILATMIIMIIRWANSKLNKTVLA